MFEKYLWKSDILNAYLKRHIASKNQLAGFYTSRPWVENRLIFNI